MCEITPTRKWRLISKDGYPFDSGRYWTYSPKTGIAVRFFYKSRFNIKNDVFNQDDYREITHWLPISNHVLDAPKSN